MIQIENLHFSHPDRSELYGGLNLKLEQGDNILLKGNNGCGKSTLLKLIVGLLRPQLGTITIAGKPDAWIDCRNLLTDTPAAFFEEAGVGLSNGKDFGAEGFVRLNFGCSRSILLAALERMDKAIRRNL